MRELIHYNPYYQQYSNQTQPPWEPVNQWPCRWIRCDAALTPPFVTAYKREFSLTAPDTVRIHVSADERYRLFLDGAPIGRGSERGDQNNWYYETYDLPLGAGNHVLVAQVWSMGTGLMPWAQISVAPGFILSPEGENYIELFGTGVAPWQAKPLPGYAFIGARGAGVGSRVAIDGAAFPWGFEQGLGDGWGPVTPYDHGNNGYYLNLMPNAHVMAPAALPPMLEQLCRAGRVRHVDAVALEQTETTPVCTKNDLSDERSKWQSLLTGNPVTIPSHTHRRVIIDLEDYYCMYPQLTTTGGADSTVRLSFCEALYEQNPAAAFGGDVISKGNRDEIEGKFFYGLGDRFAPDGGENRIFSTLWWNAGRYMELALSTGDQPLTLTALTLAETRYPLTMESRFSSSNPQLEQIIPMCFRALQQCCHETFMDCPFYEQLMYVGDTRLQALVTYVSTRDSALPQKAVRMFDASRMNHSHMINCSYPATDGKIIPSFCLWWVGMVYDYALWRGDRDFIAAMMTGVRATIDQFLADRDANGLIKTPKGWNYVDASDQWEYGVPTDNGLGVTCFLNVQMTLILEMAARLETYVGEALLCRRCLEKKAELEAAILALFWDEDNQLFADDLHKTTFSQHVQALALLNESLSAGKQQHLFSGLLSRADLVKTNVYFTHYVFEAYTALGRTDCIVDGLSPWFGLLRQGYKTTPEHFSPSTRSDCHAWGAHPIYHYFTGILGIRPARMGFETVTIRPNLGGLTHAKGEMVHPLGVIKAEFRKTNDGLSATIELPDGLTGTLVYGDAAHPLTGGKQTVSL